MIFIIYTIIYKYVIKAVLVNRIGFLSEVFLQIKCARTPRRVALTEKEHHLELLPLSVGQSVGSRKVRVHIKVHLHALKEAGAIRHGCCHSKVAGSKKYQY